MKAPENPHSPHSGVWRGAILPAGRSISIVALSTKSEGGHGVVVGDLPRQGGYHPEVACFPQVWPYWAYTYSPDPFQPKALTDAQNWAGELAVCPGFEHDPEHYTCRPQPQGWSNCWKCPPKDPTGGGYTAYEAVRPS